MFHLYSRESNVGDDSHRSVFIGEYGPADWLYLKEEVLDPRATELEKILPLLEQRAKGSTRELKVLDVASGEGRFTSHLASASRSTKVVALDNYIPYLKTARERYGDVAQALCAGNLYNLPFADETFDVVATRSTLDIMDGPRMFQEMVRVLKPKGWLYVSLVYDSTYKFSPDSDTDLELLIQRAYDRYAIEWGVSHGVRAVNGSRGGRFLPLYAWDNGLTIVRLAAADWFLCPNPVFSAEEKAILNLQLEMIYGACKRAQADPEYAIDERRLDEWRLRTRSRIESSRTTYTSHQFSILAEKPDSTDKLPDGVARGSNWYGR